MEAHIPLTSPGGDVYAYACPRCHQVAVSGQAMVRLSPGDEHFVDLTKSSREKAAACCLCFDCNTPTEARLYCDACSRKHWESTSSVNPIDDGETNTFEMALTAALRMWNAETSKPYPLTITHGRDGLGFLAFPFDLSETPSEVGERNEAAYWFIVHGSAPFGRGDTPEAALESLRNHTRRIQRGEQ